MSDAKLFRLAGGDAQEIEKVGRALRQMMPFIQPKAPT